jgi:acetoin utilization deacetylase AcuC-like enzyme
MLKIAYHSIYKHNLPEGHRFPMEKYDLLPQQLIYEGTCNEENFFTPEIPNNKYFFMVHDAEYVSDLMNMTLNQKAARKIGFPLSEDLIAREMIIADGTIKASEFAIKYGIAMNIAGGTHHAFTNKGEGFCMLNDQAIGAMLLELQNLIVVS